MNAAMSETSGYICSVKGCPNRNNRRFSLMGLCQHIIKVHGSETLEKKLNTRIENR